MNTIWGKITDDFLSFTLENAQRKSLSHKILSQNDILERDNFTATFLTEGMLFLLPKKCNSEQLLILSAGVHGNETAPMELLQQWTADIFSGVLKLSVPLVLIIGNPKAIIKSTRFIEENLNRLFDSDENKNESENKKNKNIEKIRADEIMQQLYKLQTKFPWKNVVHFDLHTAIRQSKEEMFLVLPHKEANDHSKKLLNFWAGCGLTAALRANRPAKTFSYFTQSQFNAISATVELGKVMPFGQNDMTKLAGVDKAVRQFITTADWPDFEHKKQLKLFQVKKELIKTSENFKLFIKDNFANFSGFGLGYLLAEDKSQDFEFRIDSKTEVLVFPNNQVPVGQRVGLVAELEVN